MGYTISWEPLRFTDYTYNTITILLPKLIGSGYKLTIEPWGFVIGRNETESIGFVRDGSQSPWEKTNRLPYTKEVMKALILMVEYGVTQNLDHDDRSMGLYLEALKEVHWRHRLCSYEQQKAYFTDLEAKKQAEAN
jgi:hypothetical protein